MNDIHSSYRFRGLPDEVIEDTYFLVDVASRPVAGVEHVLVYLCFRDCKCLTLDLTTRVSALDL